MKVFKAYHKGTDVLKFKRVELSSGYITERTFDNNGSEETYKDSRGIYKVKGSRVTKYDYDNFINKPNRPLAGKKVVVDGVEYELK